MGDVKRIVEGGEQAYRAAEGVARHSYGKLVAFLTARTRDVAGAEDALSEAFAAALESWPTGGVPRNPEAWLLTVARRKQIDAGRKRQREVSSEVLGDGWGAVRPAGPRDFARPLEAAAAAAQAATEMLDSRMPDDRLALMFACAHPAIDPGIRAPLILQTILGFDAASIASAFLVSPAAMRQRLVRAKNKIRESGIPLRVPPSSADDPAQLAERLDAVLEAIYAAFAEGWSDAAGTDVRRRNLAEEGIWLGRLVVSLLPGEPEALGLLALMLHAEARRPARRDSLGNYVPLAEQDPRLWNQDAIEEAESLLYRASGIRRIGRFQIEAAVQSAHAARRLTGVTDWAAILALYDALLAQTGSAVVAINRAIACAELHGPDAGLADLDRLAVDGQLAEYQPYWAARASLLASSGQAQAAAEAYERAIGLEPDPAVRRFLQSRQAGLKL